MTDTKESAIDPSDKAKKVAETCFMGMRMESLSVPEMYAAMIILAGNIVMNYSPTRADAHSNMETFTLDLKDAVEASWDGFTAYKEQQAKDRSGGTEH